MNAERNGPPQKNRIDMAAKVAEEIKQSKNTAVVQGRGKDFTKAFSRIVRRLQSNPAGFGELVRRIPYMQLIVHVGSEYPLTVRFAFHETKPLVYVMAMFLAQPKGQQ